MCNLITEKYRYEYEAKKEVARSTSTSKFEISKHWLPVIYWMFLGGKLLNGETIQFFQKEK